MATKTVSENINQRIRFEIMAALSGGGFCPLPNSSQTISGTSVSNPSKIANTASEFFGSQLSQKLLNPRMSNNPKMQFMFYNFKSLSVTAPSLALVTWAANLASTPRG